MDLAYDAATVLLSTVGIAVAIVLIFFTFGATLERKTVADQIGDVVEQTLMVLRFDPPTLAKVKAYAKSVEPTMLKDLPDERLAVDAANQRLIWWTSGVLGGVFLVTLIGVGILCWAFQLNVLSLSLEAGASIMLVSGVYIVFMAFFASKYRTIDTNAFLRSLLEHVQRSN